MLEARSHNVWLIIWPLHEILARDIVLEWHLGVVEAHIVRPAAGHVNPTALGPLNDYIVGHDQVQNDMKVEFGLLQSQSLTTGLQERKYKSTMTGYSYVLKDHSPLEIRLGESLDVAPV